MTRNRIYTDPDLLDLRRDIRRLYTLVALLAVAVIALILAMVL